MAELYGFELKAERIIEEINSTAHLFSHKKSGARVLSLVNDDENKVFGITFRTPPHDSTGLPHIMEHSVLCGSRKFPVKEPFVELLKGSLNTFLNAFTMPDRTSYPVASLNEKDFYNLVDVYLDAVFYPLLPQETLLQEGWHYELDQLGDPLVYKGVVFNEMKGAYSSPDGLLEKLSLQALYPDTLYKHDYGGDPREIPNLTFAQFRQFHDTYYHPSNAYIFFSGDDPEEKRLKLLSSYLDTFERRDIPAEIPPQPRFDEPRWQIYPYESGGDQKTDKNYVMVNWMLPEIDDIELILGLDILSHVLLGSPASPLRKALTESGLGEDLVGAGTDDSLMHISFRTGLKGVSAVNSEQVESLILETLQELAAAGIDPDTVEASLNTIEFTLRENNTGSFPRGLVILMRAIRDWIYLQDPFSPLAFEQPLRSIKTKIQAGEKYFEQLIRTYLLENSHRVTVVMEPDPELGDRHAAEERARLEAARARMGERELHEIISQTSALRLRQETPDPPSALATIPRLQLSDLEKGVRTIPSELLMAQDARLMVHDLFTNDILYLDLAFDLHSLPQRLIPYIPLFGRALKEIGTDKEDYIRLAQRIGRLTGGISAGNLLSSTLESGQEAAWFTLRGKATLAHVQDLLDLLRDLLLTVRLDNQPRFKQMVLEAKARREASLIPAGHQVVNRRLRAAYNVADTLAEQINGIQNLYFLRDLVDRVEADWSGVLSDLEEIRQRLINRSTMMVNATLEVEAWNSIQSLVAAFIEQLPGFAPEYYDWQTEDLPENEGLVIPAQVNYVGKGANLFDLGYELDGSMLVVNKYMQTTWLWEKVRVQGGAYGGFSVFDQFSGVFTFISYRDPNLTQTLENFDNTAQFLRQLDMHADELTKSIIGVISDLDNYQLPDAKGYTSMVRYLVGMDDTKRQRLRDQVLATTGDDFRRVADLLEQVAATGRVVVLGSEKAIEAANQQHTGWLAVQKVL